MALGSLPESHELVLLRVLSYVKVSFRMMFVYCMYIVCIQYILFVSCSYILVYAYCIRTLYDCMYIARIQYTSLLSANIDMYCPWVSAGVSAQTKTKKCMRHMKRDLYM